MEWTRHQANARMRKPSSATVNFHGDILFNVKAVRQIIKESKHIEIFFSSNTDELKRVGFKFFDKPTGFSNPMKFRGNGNKGANQAVASINTKIAVDMGIRNHTAKRFPLEYDKETEVWYIDIEKGEIFSTDNYKHPKK